MSKLAIQAWNNFIELLNKKEPLGSDKIKVNSKKGKAQEKIIPKSHINFIGSIAKHEKIFMEANQGLKGNSELANTTENLKSRIIIDHGLLLKTCPFCKSENISAWRFPTTYSVMCNFCGSSSGSYEELNIAVSQWNSR